MAIGKANQNSLKNSVVAKIIKAYDYFNKV